MPDDSLELREREFANIDIDPEIDDIFAGGLDDDEVRRRVRLLPAGQRQGKAIKLGRAFVDAYRYEHGILHSKPYDRGVHDQHTGWLEILVQRLEKAGFSSTEIEFEPKKTEILAKFFEASNLLNIQELGFKDRADFDLKLAELNKDAKRHFETDEEGNQFEVIEDTPKAKALRESLDRMWR